MARIYNVYAGEGTYTLPKRGKNKPVAKRFRPNGPLQLEAGEDTVRLGGGGYSARIFVGLNVGDKETYTVNDVVKLVVEARKEQGASADASILSQKGIYESKGGDVVVEPSVQIIIIDLVGKKKKEFVDEVTEVAEVLQEKLQQEVVLVEIQKSGVVKDVYSIS